MGSEVGVSKIKERMNYLRAEQQGWEKTHAESAVACIDVQYNEYNKNNCCTSSQRFQIFCSQNIN